MLLFVFPCLLFICALGMAGLAQATGQDVYRVLAIGSAGAGVVWGCAIAHWSVQLLLLLGLLWSSHAGPRLWRWNTVLMSHPKRSGLH